MKNKDDVLKYMEENLDPYHEKDFEGVKKVFDVMDKRDPYYPTIRDFIQSIATSKNMHWGTS